MDPLILGAMIFTLVVLAMVGGFILVFPLTRRLADLLEQRMLAARDGDRHAEVEALRRAVAALRDDVARLAERQDFTERLLERPDEEGGA